MHASIYFGVNKLLVLTLAKKRSNIQWESCKFARVVAFSINGHQCYEGRH